MISHCFCSVIVNVQLLFKFLIKGCFHIAIIPVSSNVNGSFFIVNLWSISSYYPYTHAHWQECVRSESYIRNQSLLCLFVSILPLSTIPFLNPWLQVHVYNKDTWDTSHHQAVITASSLGCHHCWVTTTYSANIHLKTLQSQHACFTFSDCQYIDFILRNTRNMCMQCWFATSLATFTVHVQKGWTLHAYWVS